MFEKENEQIRSNQMIKCRKVEHVAFTLTHIIFSQGKIHGSVCFKTFKRGANHPKNPHAPTCVGTQMKASERRISNESILRGRRVTGERYAF